MERSRAPQLVSDLKTLCLVDGTELLHELRAGHDVVATGLEELAGVEALALLLLASLDVLADALGEDELQVGVDVDLGDAQGDGLLDLLGDAGATVQNEGRSPVSASISPRRSKERPAQSAGYTP